MIFYDYVLPLIITVIGIVLYVVFFTLKYKNANEEEKLKPIKWLYALLVIAEVLKIFYLITQNGEFRPLRYPLVFCSTILYTIPLFIYKTKLSGLCKSATVFVGIIAFILFAAVQWMYTMSLIQGHSYFYHGAMMAIAIYMISSKIYVFERKSSYTTFLFFAAYTTFAAALSLFIGEDISLFGPNSSYLGILFNNFGFGAGMLVLLILIYLVSLGLFELIDLIIRRKRVNR